MRIVGTDAEGNEVDEIREFKVVVNGIEVTRATNAGSVLNGAMTWDLSQTDKGSTITVKSTQPITNAADIRNADIASSGNVFKKSDGEITSNGSKTEVYIPIQK